MFNGCVWLCIPDSPKAVVVLQQLLLGRKVHHCCIFAWLSAEKQLRRWRRSPSQVPQVWKRCLSGQSSSQEMDTGFVWNQILDFLRNTHHQLLLQAATFGIAHQIHSADGTRASFAVALKTDIGSQSTSFCFEHYFSSLGWWTLKCVWAGAEAEQCVIWRLSQCLLWGTPW